MIDHVSELKLCRQVILAFGFETHPFFSDVFRIDGGNWSRPVTSVVWDFLERVFYRQELSLKYQKLTFSHSFATAANEKAKKEGMVRSKAPRKNPTSLEHLLLLNSTDHFKAVASSHRMISMPVRADGDLQIETRTVEKALTFEREDADVVMPLADGPEGDDDIVAGLRGVPIKRRRLSEVLSVVAEGREYPNCKFFNLKKEPSSTKKLFAFTSTPFKLLLKAG